VTAKPDAYFAGLKKVDAMIDQGLLVGPAVPYVTNTLTIMRPRAIPPCDGLADLGRPDLHLAMPNRNSRNCAADRGVAEEGRRQALADGL